VKLIIVISQLPSNNGQITLYIF